MSHAPLTRREALRRLGAGAVAAGAFSARAATQSVTFPPKAIIRTILADLHPQDLASGATLFHEHMSFSSDFMSRLVPLMFPQRPANAGGGPQPPKPGEKYFLEDLDLMVDELSAAKKDGVACLVDAGHPDMGRDLKFLKQLSQRSGMPIVAGCGYYAQPFYTPELKAMSEDQVTRELIRQAENQPVGAFGEIGTWGDEITPDERKVFRAVGRAHAATRLPIFTHTAVGKAAAEQLDILESVGVKPAHVCIGHLGGLRDPKVEVHKAVCKRGAYVGFDRQGGGGDAAQVPLVMALVEAGYARNLLFASDFSIAARLKHNGGPGYAQTVTVFGPLLRAAGMDEQTLRSILTDNSRKFLAFVPKTRRGDKV
jgi:phosphotriesterase-related protein